MEPFTQGLIVGSSLTSGVLGLIFMLFSLLKKQEIEPIIERRSVAPMGGKAFGKKNDKRAPKVNSEFKEWKSEQEKEE